LVPHIAGFVAGCDGGVGQRTGLNEFGPSRKMAPSRTNGDQLFQSHGTLFWRWVRTEASSGGGRWSSGRTGRSGQAQGYGARGLDFAALPPK